MKGAGKQPYLAYLWLMWCCMYHQRFKSAQQRFSEKYTIEESGCWAWKAGAHRPQEHPKFWCDGGYMKASHFSVNIAGPRKLRAGEQVLHRCDNPRCVNPDHLFIGNHLANMKDMVAKGRAYKRDGERNPRAKITRAVVDEIRALYASGGISQQALADRYSLGQSTVSHIVRGETWI